MTRLDLRLLGPPEIKIDGSPVSTDRRKAIALLAYLAVSEKPQTRDHLSALLWPEYERESAYAYLRRTLWELNQMLGKGWIEADRDHVHIAKNDNLYIDTRDFEEILETGVDDTAKLAEAVVLYRDDFLAGFIVADTPTFEDWQFQQVEYFRRKYADLLCRLVDALEQYGECERALSYARRWLALDTLNESAHRSMMRLLAAKGDRTGAIRQYESCAVILKEELGIEPQTETTNLYTAILKDDLQTEQSFHSVPVSGMIALPVVQLPVMPTPFIGRRPEVEQVKALIKEPSHRLITLLGPGGIGKTRLSLQAVSELDVGFPDGRYFVPLGPVQNTDAVLPAIARELKISFYQEDDSTLQQLVGFLGDKQMLLLLDNFEHLLEAGQQISEIIRQAPNVKIVVTTRIRLNIQGEQLYPVGGMRTADIMEANSWENPKEQAKQFSSIELFLERAQRHQPGFELTRDNLTDVIEICRLVQGMPLGLELAAAWLELLPPNEIAAEIARSLDFLKTEQADVPDRQRSIRAVFESSWRLLSKQEQGAFLSLSVFVGSFSREAAQQVSKASLRTLLGLAHKSWLQQTEEGRFQLHELMRQYGEQHLLMDESIWSTAMDSFADYYLEFVDEQTSRLQSSEQLEGTKTLVEELDGNIKKAWDWLIRRRRWSDLIEYMALGILHLAQIRVRSNEVIPWFRTARLAIDPDASRGDQIVYAIFSTAEIYCESSSDIRDADPIGRLENLWQMVAENGLATEMGFWYALLKAMAQGRNLTSGENPELDQVIDQLRAENKLWELGMSYFLLANWWWGYDLNEDLLLKAKEIFEEIGVIFELGMAAEQLASHAFQQRRPLDEVIRYYDHARDLSDQMREVVYFGINLLYLAEVYFYQGDKEKGFGIFHQEQKEFKRLGQMRFYQFSLHTEGLFAARYSSFEHSLRVREECMELVQKQGSQSELAWQYFELGDIYRIFGQPANALHNYDLARPIAEKIHQNLTLGFDRRAYGDMALQEGRFEDAMELYREYDRFVRAENHPWGMVQATGRLALAQAYLGNLEKARTVMKSALITMYEWRSDDLAMQCLLAEVVCRINEENQIGAIELASFLTHTPISWNETRQQAGELMAKAGDGLSEDQVKSAVERGRSLDLDVIVKDWFQLTE